MLGYAHTGIDAIICVREVNSRRFDVTGAIGSLHVHSTRYCAVALPGPRRWSREMEHKFFRSAIYDTIYRDRLEAKHKSCIFATCWTPSSKSIYSAWTYLRKRHGVRDLLQAREESPRGSRLRFCCKPARVEKRLFTSLRNP